MKKIISRIIALLFFSLLLINPKGIIAKDKYPTPTSYKYVNDYVGIINEEYKNKIISLGKELEDKTTAEVAIVIIDSTNGVPIESYGNALFREFGIGKAKKDNGLLILLAMEDKTWRVEVGRGLEGVLPDLLTSKVMNNYGKDYFKEGNYQEGLYRVYDVFCEYIAKEYDVTLDKALKVDLRGLNEDSNVDISNYIVLAIIILVFLDILLNKGRVISFILRIIFYNSFFGGGDNNGSGGFGGGSGGSSGGFGSFGGGSSNGGGSSGGW